MKIKTKDKILNISKKLFLEKGYHETDMRLIAKESNMAIGSLYYHFKNKDELFNKVIDSIWDSSNKQFQSILLNIDLSVKEKLKIYLKELYLIVKTKEKLGLSRFVFSNIKNYKKSIDEDMEVKIQGIGSKIHNDLYNLITELLNNNENNMDDYNKHRLSTSLIYSILGIVELYSEDSTLKTNFKVEEEKDLEFLSNYVDYLF